MFESLKKGRQNNILENLNKDVRFCTLHQILFGLPNQKG
jgi:hypothetical protein